MPPSAISIYPSLPPTSNTLSSEQRTRLMRSSRKLGAVLGSTPYLVENDTSFKMLPIGKTTSRALKRQGSIFTHHHQASLLSITSTSTTSSHHPSSSASSFIVPQSLASPMQSSESLLMSPPGLSTTRRCRTDCKAPPPLFLQLKPLLPSPQEDYFSLSHSPTSSPTRPPTPVTPTVPDEAEIRRKRMAKLARHLGEHVPAELVFPSGLDSKPTLLSRRRRSRSVDYIFVEGVRSRSKDSSQQSKEDWIGEWNRSNIRDVQRELRNLRAR